MQNKNQESICRMSKSSYSSNKGNELVNKYQDKTIAFGKFIFSNVKMIIVSPFANLGCQNAQHVTGKVGMWWQWNSSAQN